MKDERKTKKQLIAELTELRQRVAELEAPQTAQALETGPLRDLIEIIHFTENVAAKMHGLLDEAEIYRVVKEEFAQSKQFSASIVLLTDDGSKLRITVHSVPPSRLKAGEKAARLRIKEFRISLNKSSIYSRVVRDGETVHVSISDIVGELFPRRLANLIVKTTGYEDAFSVLTPLKRHGKIIGALGVSSTDLAEYFIPSVKSLAQHISTALELGDERAEYKRTEERYRDLVEKEKDIIYMLDDKGTITFANPAVEDVLGYGQDELVGENFMVLIPEELQEKTGADFNALLRTGEITAETILLDKKGQPHFVEYSSTVIKDSDEVVGTRGIVRDITRRKRAEESLRESEERYRTLYESSRDGIATATLDGRITGCNQAYADMLGYSREELQGVRYQELTPSKWQPFNQEIFEEMMERGYSHEFEKEYIRKDGTVFPVSLRSWRIDDEAGNPIGLCSIVRDITERRRAEEELATYRDRLEELVEERTAALMQVNERLRWEIAERRRAEEAMQIQRGELQVILDSVPALILYKDRENRFIRVNRTCAEMLGRPMEEIEGQSCFEIFPTDQAEAFWRDDKEVIASGHAKRNIIEPVETAEGTRWVQTDKIPYRNEEGNVIGVIGFATDITERKRAEEALELRVKQLAALSQASQAVTASLELDQVLAEIVSLASEVVGSDYTSVVLVDEAGHLGESADNVPGVPAIEYRIRDEGLTRWIVRSRQAAIIDEIGEDGAMTPDLGEGASRFANPPIVAAGLKSLAGLPLMVKDRLLGVLYLHSLRAHAFQGQLPLLTAFANQAAIAVENARLYESVQRELAERVRAEEGQRKALAEALQATHALRESEERYRAIFEQAADSIVLIDAETGALVEFNDRAHESLGYTREEFEKLKIPDFEIVESAEEVAKHIETVIKEGADTFETKQGTKSGEVRDVLISVRAISVHGRNLVQGIWRDITERRHLEEQVRQQERMAAVGQLAGGIAHDFNNFLTTIMLYAQILLRKPHLPPDLMPSIEVILDESQRAAQLVRQILDFSRRSLMEARPIDLTSSIQESMDILRRTLPENIRLILEVGPEEYVVNADSTRLQQVVMNLALNARDAMPEGGELRIGLSRIAVRPEEAPPVAEMSTGDWVCLAVSDTGIGMTEEVRSHLFEPFFTTKEPGKGTGLGLAQVYGIVKQHEGCIGVDTDARQGTTLRIYLPAYREERVQEVSEEASALPEGKGEVILLAEDEEGVREAGREMLESLGYQVLTAADGRKALEVYKSAERVDLVLTDLVMPEMGGRELIQRLKKTEPQLRALVITGYALTESLRELKEAGILDVVQKPLEVNALAEAVHRALDADRHL
jgi:PAS domain S-box-containing protein